MFKVYKNDLISDVIRRGEKWEPFLHEVFERYITQDSVVIEGGCHIGTHSVRLAQLAKKVLCFEPLESSLNILEENLYANHCRGRVELFQKGLSDTISDASFAYVNKDNIGGAVMGQDKGQISLVTIDSLNLDQLDFIKLDIEGFEEKAIRGGLETIKRCRPIIAVECWDDYPNASLEHASKVYQFLISEYDYRIIQLDHHDFLLIPKEKV